MSALSKHRVLIAGIISLVAARYLYSMVYTTLTRASSDREKDWLFRLSLSTLAMIVPFLVTVALAIIDGRRGPLSWSARLGCAIAVISLGLTYRPLHDGVYRWRQTRNLALRDVVAPDFATLDLFGHQQRLADYRGDVVLVNIWATWCVPCRVEMPKLDALYRQRKSQGFVVFGISDEDTGLQRKFLEKFPVTYPLLTVNGNVPAMYRDIARYPAIFLIDRAGQLQPAPAPDQPFEKIEGTVDALLSKK